MSTPTSGARPDRRGTPTRSLRSNPDLSQLKRQAKELLKSFIAGDPAAVDEVSTHYHEADPGKFALHDAQLVIARAYGLETWPKLVEQINLEPVLDTDELVPFAVGTGREIRAISTAARNGDIDSLRSMLDAKPDLVHCGTYGVLPRDCYRPLHFAVHANQLETVKFLLSRGAHVLDEFLLHSINQSLEIAEKSGFTYVYEALDADRRDRFGYRPEVAPVIKAIEERDPDRALKLLNEDPKLLHATDESGNAPIHKAAMTRQLDLIRHLAALGANLDHTRFDGSRPVDLVGGDYWFRERDQHPDVARESVAVTGFLLALGAEYGLCTAIRLGDIERVRALLAERPELANELSNDPKPPSSAGDHGRQRPIATAAKYGRHEIARLLIGAGADVNLGVPLWSPQGHALHAACGNGDLEMAKLLLEAGADPNARVESSGNCFSIMGKIKAETPELEQEMRNLLISYGGEPEED